jgi:hypothetical protein
MSAMHAVLQRHLRLTLIIGLLFGSTLGAEIVTNYENPKRFTDFELTNISKNATNRIFDRKIKSSPVLKLVAGGGRSLELSFTDIDMAGYINPFVGRFPSNSVRIIKGSSPPKISFNYTLKNADGQPLASGEARLVDVGLSTLNSLRQYQNTDFFDFEIELIEQWAVERFLK